MYSEVLPQSLWELIEKLHSVLQEGEFYLAGGTPCVSILYQLEYRISNKEFRIMKFMIFFLRKKLSAC